MSEQLAPMYAVSAHVTIPTDAGFYTAHLPTFYLMSDVQGIVSEDHATRIARHMLTSLGHADENVYVCAVATSANAH